MNKPAALIALVLAAMAASGCSPLLYPAGPAFAPYAPPRPVGMVADPERSARGRWDAVMRLPAGSIVDVLSMDGEAYVGTIAGADRTAVRVVVNGIEEQIPRHEVMRVDLVDLPGSEVGAAAKRAGIGAAVGVGAAALISGVIGGSAWPPPGALLRGGAAIGGVAGGQAELIARQGRLVYLAEHSGLAPYLPGGGGAAGRAAPLRIARSYAARDWAAILELPRGGMVRVVRANGWRHQGTLLAVDDASLRLDVDGAELRITRALILSVDVLETFAPSPVARGGAPQPPAYRTSFAAAATSASSSSGFPVLPGAAPLMNPFGLALSFGGAQSYVLHIPAAVASAPARPAAAPSAPAPSRVMRAAICPGPSVRVRR